jgi:hypothetical protein
VAQIRKHQLAEPLSPSASERRARIDRIFDLAVEVFGGEHQAAEWLKRSSRLLRNEGRIGLLDTGLGMDGIDGMFSGGRWHSRGERVTYFGAPAAIVVLERLANTDPDLLPLDLRPGYFEFPDDITTAISFERSRKAGSGKRP